MTRLSSAPIIEPMSEESDIHEMLLQVAVLEERMEAHQAKYESALDRLRADMARQDTEMARRDNRILWAIISLTLAVIIALLRPYAFPGP